MNNEHVNKIFHQPLKDFQALAALLAKKNSDDANSNLVSQGKPTRDVTKKESKKGKN